MRHEWKQGKTSSSRSSPEIGDTVTSSALREQAAELLKKDVSAARKTSDKHFIRFLAATQYFLGGHYTQAKELCQKIQVELLPKESQAIYRNFLRDVKERVSPKYVPKMRQMISQLWEQEKSQQVIEFLQKHPYVYPAYGLAWVRAQYCAETGDYHAAAIFYGDAVRFGLPLDLTAIFATAVPLQLLAKSKLEEAWQYVEHLLTKLPHTLIYATATLIRFYQGLSFAEARQRNKLWRDQVAFCEETWRRFEEMPAAQQKDQAVKGLVAPCLVATAIALRKFGESRRASEIFDRAVNLDPSVLGTYGEQSKIEEDGEALIPIVNNAVKTYQPEPWKNSLPELISA